MQQQGFVGSVSRFWQVRRLYTRGRVCDVVLTSESEILRRGLCGLCFALGRIPLGRAILD